MIEDVAKVHGYTLRHQSGFAELLIGFGYVMAMPIVSGLFLALLLGSMHIYLQTEIMYLLMFLATASIVFLFACDMSRLNRERLITVSEEGLTYQAFKNDINSLRWDQIERVTLYTGGGRHRTSWWQVKPSHGSSFDLFHNAPFYIRQNLSFLNRGYFSHESARTLLYDVLRVKLQGRVFCKHDFEETAGWPSTLVSKHQVEAAKILESWGDIGLAEQLLREDILMARFHKKQWPEYLSTYTSLLKKLGRDEEAARVEATPPEQLNELAIFAGSTRWPP